MNVLNLDSGVEQCPVQQVNLYSLLAYVILIRAVQLNWAVPYDALAIAPTVVCTLLQLQLSLSFLLTAVNTRLAHGSCKKAEQAIRFSQQFGWKFQSPGAWRRAGWRSNLSGVTF